MPQLPYPAPPAWEPQVVRQMRAADLPDVLSMLRHDARAGHYADGLLRPERAAAAEGRIAAMVESGRMMGDGYRVAASVGMEWGRVVSYAFVRWSPRDASLSELWMLGVDPGLRFQCLGKRLLDQVLAGPACAGRAVMARCHPVSCAMRLMLAHRGFATIGVGAGGVCLLGRGFSPELRRGLAG